VTIVSQSGDGGTVARMPAHDRVPPRWAPRLPGALPGALVLGSALAVAWRLPFAGLPITTDEAGYATVARLWSHGELLYRQIWVDRPQGLLLVFRAVLHVNDGSPGAIRGAAIVAGVLLLLALTATAFELGGRRYAATVALLGGAFGCSPFIESFTLAGELVASVPAVASAYCFLRWLNRGGMQWIALAGLLTGCAVMVKQSAFDAGLAAAILLVTARPAGWRRALGLLVGAALVPVAACVTAAPSAGDWWFGVVSYRGQGDSLLTGPAATRWHELTGSLQALGEGLAPLLVLGLRGLAAVPTFVRLWLGTALIGVLGGGQFHAHYYIQLVPPLTLAAAVGLERMLVSRRRALELAVALAAALAAAVTVLPAAGASTASQVRLFFPHDLHLADDATVARAVAARTTARDTILVVPPTASIYYLARRRPAVGYLWVRNVQTIPAAAQAERRALATGAPAAVVVEGALRDVRRDGVTPAEILSRYRRVAGTAGATVYLRRD